MHHPVKIPQTFLYILSLLFLKAGFAFRIEGKNHLKKISGPFILAGNHTSLLDSIILLASVRHPFLFLMDQSVLGWKWVGPVLPYTNVLTLDQKQSGKALKKSIQTLRNGQSLCIFPEGKLTENGQLNDFNEGVAFIQDKTSVPILPFAIRGGFEAWPYGDSLPHFKPVVITFGNALYPDTTMSRQEVSRKLKGTVESLMIFEVSQNNFSHRFRTFLKIGLSSALGR